MTNKIEKILLLSDAQKGILYQYRTADASVYTEVICLKLLKHYKGSDIETAWQSVAESNMILRSSVKWEKLQQPVLLVTRSKQLSFEYVEKCPDIHEVIQRERNAGIRIDREAVRFVICTDESEDQYLIIVSHHIFLDGWSTGILVSEFARALNGENIYKTQDYDQFLQYIQNKDISQEVVFWQNHLLQYSGKMNYPRLVNHSEVHTHSLTLSDDLIDSVRAYSAKCEITPATFFMSVWAAFLSQYNRGVVDFGVVTSGRSFNESDWNQTAGLFINVFPFHMQVRETDNNIKQWINSVEEVLSSSMVNAKIPFPTIKTKLSYSLSEFNTLIVVENYPVSQNTGKDMQLYHVSEDTQYDITVQIHMYDRWQIKLLSAEQSSADLLLIMDGFFALISHFLSADLHTEFSLVCPRQYISLTSYAPFDQTYLKQSIDECSVKLSQPIQIQIEDLQMLGRDEQCTDTKTIRNLFIGLEYLVYSVQDRDEANRILTDFMDKLEKYLSRSPYGFILIHSLEKMFIHAIDMDVQGLCTACYEKIQSMAKPYSYVIHSRVFDSPELSFASSIFDPIAFQQANIPFQKYAFRDMAMMITRKINAGFSNQYKLIILDCDNTLWTGTCAEDGYEKIILADAQKQFQAFLKRKKSEGFLLALCSKNYEEDVKKVFSYYHEMPLSYDDFLIKKINWQNKPDNIISICKELNLSESSVIFIDDSFVECASVLQILPDVLTLWLPEKEQDIMPFFQRIWALDKLHITKEDASRHQMYIDNMKRQQLQEKYNVEYELIESLQIRIVLTPMGAGNIDRISQLSYRTNQCNLNGIRLSVADLNANNSSGVSYAINVSDRYGSYGIVGYICCETQSDTLRIRNFFMSCRVLSRYVEHKVFQFVLESFAQTGLNVCELTCDITGRNNYFIHFLQHTGWEIEQKEKELYCKHSMIFDSHSRYLPLLAVCIGNEDTAGRPEDKEFMEAEATTSLQDDLYFGPVQDNDNEFYYDTTERYLALAQQGVTYEYLLPLLLRNENADHRRRNCDLSPAASAGEITPRLKAIWKDILGTDPEPSDDFFASGGSSLQLMELISRIYTDIHMTLRLSDVAVSPTFSHISGLLQPEINKEKIIPIQPTQQMSYDIPHFSRRFFSAHAMGEGTNFNMPFAFRIEGPVLREQLESAVQSIISNHRIFRSRFNISGNGDSVTFFDNPPFQMEQIESDEYIKSQDLRSFIHLFSLQEGYLLRIKLIRTADTNISILFIDFHHGIMDAKSLILFIGYINRIYAGKELKVPEIDYFDYVQWFAQTNLVKQHKSKQYWIGQLKDSITALPFRTINQASVNGSASDNRHDFEVPEDLYQKIKKAAARCRVPVFSFVLASFLLFLYKISGNRDINIGTPVDMRDIAAAEQIIGMMVNTVVIRGRIQDESFHSFSHQIADTVKEAVANKDCMYQDVLQSIRQNAQAPEAIQSLYNVMFILQEFAFPSLEIPGCTVEALPVHSGVAQSGLILECIVAGKGLKCNFTFDTKLLNMKTVKRFSRQWMRILESVCSDVYLSVDDYQITDETELMQIRRFEAAPAVKRPTCRIYELFENQAKIHPDLVCLSSHGKEYTYREVNTMSNCLAGKLKGYIEPGNTVLVSLHSDFEIIIAMLAVLKAGGVYLPVDPDIPTARLGDIIKTCDVRMAVSCDKERFSSVPVFSTDFDMNNECRNTKLSYHSGAGAYIIYTSGTTGASKGVLVSHDGIVNTILSRKEEYGVSPEDTCLLLMSPVFDGFMTSVFTPLASGARLVLPDRPLIVENLVHSIKRNEVTHFIATPTMYKAILQHPDIRSADTLKTVVLAGEALSSELAADSLRLLPHAEVVNEYGPTENSVLSTIKRNIAPGVITVGKPIPNTRARIIDDRNRLCAIGITGELCLSGRGLVIGYIGDERLTGERFVKGLCGDTDLWYRTGDLACWDDHGEIILSVRKDQQIKIRGYRVDLLEIESAVRKMSSISDCCVIYKKESGEIACYYVSQDTIERRTFVSSLRESLFLYMLPHQYIRLSRLPMNANGKLDLKTLDQYIIQDKRQIVYSHEVTNKILSVFKDVLQRDSLTSQDNFFANGGTSLEAVELQNKMKEQLGLDIKIVDIFTYPTAEDLGELFAETSGGQFRHSKLAEKTQFIMPDIHSRIGKCSVKINIPIPVIYTSILRYSVYQDRQTRHIPVYAYHDRMLYPIDFTIDENTEIEDYFMQVRDALNKKGRCIQDMVRLSASESPFIIISFEKLNDEGNYGSPLMLSAAQSEAPQKIIAQYDPDVVDETAVDRIFSTAFRFFASL